MADKIYVMREDNALKQAVVTHGAIQASIEGSTIYIGSADKTPKASANFDLTPTNVTLNAFEPATISASRLGDGLIKCYGNDAFNISQINATDFQVLGKIGGTVNAGFWLDETQDYYGAAKNVNFVINPKQPEVLMHFNDAAEPFLNEGTATIDSIEGAEYASIEGGGKFGSCLVTSESVYAKTAMPLGGKDFTLQVWNKTPLGSMILFWSTANRIICYNNNGKYKFINEFAGTEGEYATDKSILSEWTHLAMCYEHSAGKLYCFIGGELVHIFDCTIPRENLQSIRFNNSYFDEMLLLDDVCMWKENFTPPTAPY